MTPDISIVLFSSRMTPNVPIPFHEPLGRTFNLSPFQKVHDRQNYFIRFSKSFWSGELGTNGYESEFDDLSFLPIESFTALHPETLRVLRKISRVFIESSIKPDIKVDIKEVLNMLESVYKINPSREVTIYNQDIEFEEGRKILSIVLGFCALLRIPKEITTMLLEEVVTIPEMNKASKYVNIFKEKGWSCIEFKKGLPIRLKRKHMPTRWSQLSPRNLIFHNARDIEYASIAIWEANKTIAPPKRMKRQEIEAELNEIGSKLANTDIQIEDIKFFPHQSPALKYVRRVLRKGDRLQLLLKKVTRDQTEHLQKKGYAGFLSYVLINCFFFTASALWASKEITPHSSNRLGTHDMGSILLIVKKFMNVFLIFFVGSKLTKIPRLYVSTSMASLINTTLLFFKKNITTKLKDWTVLINSISLLVFLVTAWGLLLKRGLG